MDIVIYEEDYLTRALRARLVIVSVYMPKEAGAQWVRSIQAVHPETPIIAISGQFRCGLSAAGSTDRGLGVQQAIAKPLNRTDLLDAVRAIIGVNFAEYLEAVRQLDELAQRRFQRRVIHLAVRWVLDQGVDVALWGGRHPNQIEPALDVTSWSLDQASRALIERIVNAAVLDSVGPEFKAPPARTA